MYSYLLVRPFVISLGFILVYHVYLLLKCDVPLFRDDWPNFYKEFACNHMAYWNAGWEMNVSAIYAWIFNHVYSFPCSFPHLLFFWDFENLIITRILWQISTLLLPLLCDSLVNVNPMLFLPEIIYYLMLLSHISLSLFWASNFFLTSLCYLNGFEEEIVNSYSWFPY